MPRFIGAVLVICALTSACGGTSNPNEPSSSSGASGPSAPANGPAAPVAGPSAPTGGETPQAEAELSGVIDSLSGSAAGFQFRIGSRQVRGDAATAFVGHGDRPDTFASLRDGVTVEVKGRQAEGFIQATRVHVEDQDDDDNPRQPPQNPEAEFVGTLTALGGTAPALTLTVGGTTVRTSSATAVKRRGDPLTLAALRVGQVVEVEGTRRTDGSVDARTLTIEDDNEDENEVEFEGTMSGLTGACPSLSFTVSGRGVTTNASTEFDKTACTAFRNGDRVQVKGDAQSNGSVVARRLRRK